MVERDIPEPPAGPCDSKCRRAGICHSDSLVKEGHWPWGLSYPRVPGHEVAGVIDAVGPEVPDWKPGDRVGVGWYGGHCESCRRGSFITCANQVISGIGNDSGYADYMVAPFLALDSGLALRFLNRF